MALTSALNMAIRGMMTTAIKTSLTSQNISNADKVGYSRKELQVNYLTTNSGSTPVSGMVVGAQDRFLHAALSGDISSYQRTDTISASLDYYVKKIGTTDGSNTLSSIMDDMYSALQYLSTNPESAADKSQVIQVALNLTNNLRSLSMSIQDLRQNAEHSINNSINTINAALDRIDILNEAIGNGESNNAGLADYEDQRSLELQNLAKEMDIQYFYGSDNRLQIFTSSGHALLLADPHHLDYTVNNVVNGATLYPGGFSPITLDGADVTTSITGGKLGGNIELRDITYVNEQAKLNEFVNVLKTQVNTLFNNGASVPSRNVMTGSLNGLTVATAFTATGSIKVAVTDNTGMVVNTSNINLAAMTTVNDVLVALNGIAGITAAINANGELSITAAPAPNGVSINPLNSSVTSSSGESFSQFFGLNDLFIGTSAENIEISSYLKTGPQYLSIGVLNPAAIAGERGVNRGDGTIANDVSDILQLSSTAFSAAGNFSAQTNSLISYVQAIISDAASQADLTQRENETNYNVFKASTSLVTSKEGVNVDEETAKLLLQQNQYQAGAQVVKTVQDMLRTLIDAMR